MNDDLSGFDQTLGYEDSVAAMSTFNKARVADLHATMRADIERCDIPGIVTLIARCDKIRGDEIHIDAIGIYRPCER